MDTSCEEREASENFKMKRYVFAGIRTINLPHRKLAPQTARPL